MAEPHHLRYTKSLQVLYQAGSQFWQPISCSKSVTVGLSILFAFLTSGVVYGFPALSEIMLFKEQAFSSVCKVGEGVPCRSQENYVALTITIAMAAVSFAAFPAGIFLDYAGPRTTVCVSSLVFSSGLLSLAFAKVVSDFLYIYGFFALAVGGPSLLMAMNNFAELFNNQGAAILTMQNGGFQLSSIMMLVVQILIKSYGFSFQQVFLLYTIIPGIIFFTSLLLFPTKAYGTEEGPGNRGEPHRTWLIRRILVAQQDKIGKVKNSRHYSDLASPLLLSDSERNSVNSIPKFVIPEIAPEETVKRPPELYNVDFKKQFSSLPFLSITTVLTFFILIVNFHIATERDQLFQEVFVMGMSQEAAEKTVSDYIANFSLSLPVTGVIAVPFVAFLLVKRGLVASFTCIGALFFLFQFISLPNILPLESRKFGYVCFAASRPFVYSAVATYIAEVFGFSNFGKLYGLVQLGGLLVGPVQYAVLIAVQQYFKNDYFWVNFSLLVTGVLVFSSFTVYLLTSVFCGFFFRPHLPNRRETREVFERGSDLLE